LSIALSSLSKGNFTDSDEVEYLSKKRQSCIRPRLHRKTGDGEACTDVNARDDVERLAKRVELITSFRKNQPLDHLLELSPDEI
jgi:hypothetical protein